MEKKGKNKYGNVYEIKLPNGKYTYICWIKQFSFGVFNYHSEKPVDNLDSLLSVGFKIYISGKETAIRKKIWQLIGHIDLEKENIEFPDLAIFMSNDKEHFIEQSRIMGSVLKPSCKSILLSTQFHKYLLPLHHEESPIITLHLSRCTCRLL